MMRVLFFGALKDVAGGRELSCDANVCDVPALRDWLASQNAVLAAALQAPGVRIAINRAFATDDAALPANAEIAFMSPLSGG